MFCSTPRTEPTTEYKNTKINSRHPPSSTLPVLSILSSAALPVRLCQSLPPQPYALEVSKRVREGLVISSRQPQLGGGDGQRWMMMTMTTATAAVDGHGGATPSPPAVPDCRRICVSLPPGAVGVVRPSGVIGHGIGGKYIPIMARLAEARRWSKRRQTRLSSPDLTAIHNE